MAVSQQARRYESMIVLRSDLQEAGTKEQIERVRKTLEGHGATIGGVHEWGLRELAYEIGKERRGYYVLVEYVASSAAVAELERTLKLSDMVLRFVSVRQEKNVPAGPALPRDEDTPARVGGEDDDEDGLGAVAEASDIE